MTSVKTEKKPGSNSKLVHTLSGKTEPIPAIWLMRQAGRYLPEYRKVRTKADGFLNLCYKPDLATEVTIQPIQRYDLDAAILFSDILIVPHALGQNIMFVEGDGPRLEPIQNAAGLKRLNPNKTDEKFAIICQTVAKVRKKLSNKKALIGFCGAPWTVATYMVAGRGTVDQSPARTFAYSDPKAFKKLIDILTETSISYLTQQIKAGANVIQIFDSWAGSLPDDEFDLWVVQPTKKIVAALKSTHPDIPIIGFPRAAGSNVLHYIRETGIQGLGCDTGMSLSYMRDVLAPTGVALQGNLDPLLLVSGSQAMENRIIEILEAMRGTPFIFNLGHGIVPQTPPENVTRLIEIVRNFK